MQINLLQVTSFLTLVPPALLLFRREVKKDFLFGVVVFFSLCGALLWVYMQQAAGWNTSLSAALWLTISASLIIYIIISTVTKEGWRLLPFLFPYLILLGIFAIVWDQVSERHILGPIPMAWIGAHIIVSLATYGFLTLAALAALAAMVQERAIKSKTRTRLTRQLPSVAASEKLLVNLLISTAIILTIGLLTGIASLYLATGYFFAFNHKIILVVMVFAIVLCMLFMHFYTGIRGRAATRFVLLAYLFLTLAYPGVKFVRDVLLSS